MWPSHSIINYAFVVAAYARARHHFYRKIIRSDSTSSSSSLSRQQRTSTHTPRATNPSRTLRWITHHRPHQSVYLTSDRTDTRAALFVWVIRIVYKTKFIWTPSSLPRHVQQGSNILWVKKHPFSKTLWNLFLRWRIIKRV